MIADIKNKRDLVIDKVALPGRKAAILSEKRERVDLAGGAPLGEGEAIERVIRLERGLNDGKVGRLVEASDEDGPNPGELVAVSFGIKEGVTELADTLNVALQFIKSESDALLLVTHLSIEALSPKRGLTKALKRALKVSVGASGRAEDKENGEEAGE